MFNLESFSVLLCSIFLAYFWSSSGYNEKLTALQREHEMLREKLDAYAISMGPKHTYIFKEYPEWGRQVLTVENSRIGAANKKSKEWLGELKEAFKTGGPRDQFDNLLEYIKKKQHQNYLKENEVEQVKETDLNSFWTSAARNEINMKSISDNMEERTLLFKAITKKIKDLHKAFGNDEGELSLKHGSFGELTKLADQLEKVKEEPELFADFLKRFDAEVTAMQISFGRLTKISKNISKAQEATVTQAMEYSEGLKKVERLKNMIISTNNEISEKTHQPIVEIFNRLHKSGNELMAEAEELEKFNHVWLKEEFDALQKVIKPGSKLVIDEMQNSEGMSFRVLILKSHLERYERGLEGNRYQAVNDAYEVMLECDKFLKERFDELEALLTDDGAEEFKKKALKQTAELGRLLKTVSRAGADLEWIK